MLGEFGSCNAVGVVYNRFYFPSRQGNGVAPPSWYSLGEIDIQCGSQSRVISCGGRVTTSMYKLSSVSWGADVSDSTTQ